MQKEGKMLINKEQNQVYVIPEKKIPYLKTIVPFHFRYLNQCYRKCSSRMNSFFLLLNKMFPLLYFECPIFV